MVERSGTKEDEVIQRIANSSDLTQRELAAQTGISLGMTNIILKRLVHKGYVKMKRLNRRNIKYVLTPEGFAQYTHKSYSYLMSTISSVRQLKQKIKQVLANEVRKGASGFAVQGDGELADLAELALKDLSSEAGTNWTREEAPEGWLALVCDADEDWKQDEHPGEVNLSQAIVESGR